MADDKSDSGAQLVTNLNEERAVFFPEVGESPKVTTTSSESNVAATASGASAVIASEIPEPPPPPPPPPPPRLPPIAFHTHAQEETKSNCKQTQKELRLKLVQALEKGDLSSVQYLLSEKLNLDCILLFSKTPLTYAIELGNFDIARALVEAGADVNAREPIASARQALHVAVGACDVNITNSGIEIMDLLVQRDAEVDGRNGCGATPLMLASASGAFDAVRFLQEHGADINASDYVGRTSLHRAAEGLHADIMAFLLANGGDIDVRDSFGWTALYHSVVFGHVTVIRFLLANGVVVNGVDGNNRSPLAVACNRLCPPNVRVVLSSALDYHKRERRIPTSALHHVLNSQDCTLLEFSIVQLLVNAGARLNVPRLTDFFQLCPNLALQSKHVLLHYLCLSGCIGQQTDLGVAASSPYVPQIRLWMQEQLTLQQLCRVAIRGHLASVCGCRDVHRAADALPVPLSVRNYLNLSDFADMYPGFASRLTSM